MIWEFIVTDWLSSLPRFKIRQLNAHCYKIKTFKAILKSKGERLKRVLLKSQWDRVKVRISEININLRNRRWNLNFLTEVKN